MTKRIIEDEVGKVLEAFDVKEIPRDRSRLSIAIRVCCMARLYGLGMSIPQIGKYLNINTTSHHLAKLPGMLIERIGEWDTKDPTQTREILFEVMRHLSRLPIRRL